MTDETITRHHNAPPLADQIALAFSVEQLGEDHDALAQQVQALTARAAVITIVDGEEANTAASALVIELREMVSRIERTHDEVKKPVWEAGKNVTAFFDAMNRNDTRRPGAVTGQKLRLEGLIRDHGFRVAEANRKAAEAAAAAQREAARKAQEAAAAAEAANRPVVAEVLMDTGIKAETAAENLEDRARGPVQEVARQRTTVATTGLRAQPGFDITDEMALRSSLGVLGMSFGLGEIGMALRKFRTDRERMKKWEFRDDDQHAQRRVVVAEPAVPGVEFFITYQGSVRA